MEINQKKSTQFNYKKHNNHSKKLNEIINRILNSEASGFVFLVSISDLDKKTSFQNAILRNIDFSNQDLSGFDFRNADIINCTFTGARVSDANWSQRNIKSGIFSKAKDWPYLKEIYKIEDADHNQDDRAKFFDDCGLYEKAAEQYKLLNSMELAADRLNKAAHDLIEIGNYERAKLLFNNIDYDYKIYIDIELEASTLFGLSLSEFMSHEIKDSKSHCAEALNRYRTIGNLDGQILCHVVYCAIYYIYSNREAARESVREIFRLASFGKTDLHSARRHIIMMSLVDNRILIPFRNEIELMKKKGNRTFGLESLINDV